MEHLVRDGVAVVAELGQLLAHEGLVLGVGRRCGGHLCVEG